jgi:hypothetical protein
MLSNRRSPLLALVPLLLIAACGREPAGPPALTLDRGPSFNSSPVFFPFNFVVAACNELVDVTGQFHPVFRFHEDGDGGTHFKGHFNAEGIGIGLTSGAIYNWNDAINFEENFRGPQQTFTDQQSLELIGRGQATNFRLRFLFHVTVTPNGVVHIGADKFTVDCN